MECEKLFYKIDGALGVVDIQSQKIITAINKKLLVSGFRKPGSVFKIITALAALKTGVAGNNIFYNCTGHEQFLNSDFSCWLKKGHGKLNFENALANSCNIYFYHIAELLDYDEIYNLCDAFYLGKRTPFEIEGEGAGLFKKNYDQFDKYDFCIGQSVNLLVTPLQMLYMICVVAKKGRFAGFNMVIDNDLYARLNSGLVSSVNYGTAKDANIIKHRIAGKTGTSSKKFGKKTNSWFVGFAPSENPKIAIVIFLNYGRGASNAAPLAKKVFKKYFSIFYPDSP